MKNEDKEWIKKQMKEAKKEFYDPIAELERENARIELKRLKEQEKRIDQFYKLSWLSLNGCLIVAIGIGLCCIMGMIYAVLISRGC